MRCDLGEGFRLFECRQKFVTFLLYLFLKLCWNAQKVGRLVDRRLILVFGATQGERDRQGFRGWNSLVEACQLNVSVGACNGQLKDYYSTRLWHRTPYFSVECRPHAEDQARYGPSGTGFRSKAWQSRDARRIPTCEFIKPVETRKSKGAGSVKTRTRERGEK